MKSRAARLTLLVLFIGSLGAAAWLFAHGEMLADSQSASIRAFDAQARSASRALVDARAAQQAYVAAGQAGEFWPGRVAEGITAVRAGIAALRAGAATPEAAAELDAAVGLLDSFAQMDRRAREYRRTGQNLLASDLIFGDGLEMTGGIDARIERARAAEVAAGDAAVETHRGRQVFALTAGAAAAMLVVLLLLPGADPSRRDRMVVSRGAREAAMGHAAVFEGASARGAASVLSLADAGGKPAEHAGAPGAADLAFDREAWSRPARLPENDPDPAPEPTAAEPMAAGPGLQESAPAPVVQLIQPATDFRSLASLCTDLARVIDTADLPSLLDRASNLLEARGIILWIADPDGRELNAIVAHGYPAQLVNRLGTLDRDAENATAAAFRTSMLQTVRGGADSNAAIAAPLVTPAGCVGVMAAEVARDAEREDSRLAAAAIVAAQLATLVGPPTRNSTRAEVVG